VNVYADGAQEMAGKTAWVGSAVASNCACIMPCAHSKWGKKSSST
jgi:hypothetical protein